MSAIAGVNLLFLFLFFYKNSRLLSYREAACSLIWSVETGLKNRPGVEKNIIVKNYVRSGLLHLFFDGKLHFAVRLGVKKHG